MLSKHNDSQCRPIVDAEFTDDEGGLRAPPELSGWRKAWWWFDFIVLVKLARLRFIGILLIIGVIITQWDTLVAYHDKWTRPANASQSAGVDVEYFCPMHPSIVRDSPNEKCPICFMPLSKRKKGDAHIEALPAGIVNRVQLTPYRVVLAGVSTWQVDFVPLAKDISAAGYIEFNERGQRAVAARVAGRIDKLFANETGKMVSAGDLLASLYSPDLFVTAQNLREAKAAGNASTLESARNRLRLQGIDDGQIDEIVAADKADPHVMIRSPISGHIIKKYVREGQYVEEGSSLYDLADLSTVWIQAQIYEDDMAFLPAGDEHGAYDSIALPVTATTRALPGQSFSGKLAFVYPHADQFTRTVTVRFEVDNPDHKLRPGATATVTLQVPPKDIKSLADASQSDPESVTMFAAGRVLAVPESSVIDTGTQRIVYRETLPGVYEGVVASLGALMTNPDGGRFFPVLKGLAKGDRVVTSGSFLVDAETRLNPAAGSIYFGGSGGSQNNRSTVASVRPTTPQDPDAEVKAALDRLSPEDRELVAAQGRCPILTANRLGVMGVPEKIVIEGQAVFLCCPACREKALKNPARTLAKVKELQSKGQSSEFINHDADASDEKAITASLATLPEEDRRLAESQRFCPVLDQSRLGAMGPPAKLVIEGQPLFICCPGCKAEALKDPAATLRRVAELKNAHGRTPTE